MTGHGSPHISKIARRQRKLAWVADANYRWLLRVNFRLQRRLTQVGHQISDKAVVGYGVPQRSILSPLLPVTDL